MRPHAKLAKLAKLVIRRPVDGQCPLHSLQPDCRAAQIQVEAGAMALDASSPAFQPNTPLRVMAKDSPDDCSLRGRAAVDAGAPVAVTCAQPFILTLHSVNMRMQTGADRI